MSWDEPGFEGCSSYDRQQRAPWHSTTGSREKQAEESGPLPSVSGLFEQLKSIPKPSMCSLHPLSEALSVCFFCFHSQCNRGAGRLKPGTTRVPSLTFGSAS